jgi:hypothetical protein
VSPASQAGCGTGENALHVASLGLSVLGPHPGNGWKVAAIEPDRIQTRYHDDGAPAWLATIKRL